MNHLPRLPVSPRITSAGIGKTRRALSPSIVALVARALTTLSVASAPISAHGNQPPTVSLTAPQADATLTLPTTLTLAATASDPNGFVAKVEFFEGPTKLGETTHSPYALSRTGTMPGPKSLRARAVDNAGAATDSALVPIRLLASVPFIADFEASEGYHLGSLHGQHGWVVSSGSAQIVTNEAAHGAQSVILSAGAIATEVDQEFGAYNPSSPVVYVDFFAKPVAGADYASSTLFEVDAARVAFVKTGTTGQFAALDGDGAGTGTWKNLGPTVALDAAAAAASWQRITARLNYTTKTWDLYINGVMVEAGIKFRLKSATYFSWLSLKGHTAAPVQLNDIYIGAHNPLFTDINNNGIDDTWERSRGLSLMYENRTADADGDGASNLQEYLDETGQHRRSAANHMRQSNKADSETIVLSQTATVTNSLVPDTGLRLWLDASSGAQTVDGRIATWLDRSELHNNATQSNSSRRPTLVTNTLNGLPIVRFDGGGTALALPNVMAAATAGEAFVVLKAATNDSNSLRRYLWKLGPSGGLQYPGDGQGRISDDFGSTSLFTTGVPNVTVTEFNLVNVSSIPNEWNLRLNGRLHFTTNINAVGFRSDPLLGSDGNTASFNGDVAELIIYNRLLTPPEREMVGSYLANKYKLPSIGVPPIPSNLAVSAISASRVLLTWSMPQPNYGITYQVERARMNGVFSTVAEISDGCSYIDKNLLAATAYQYRIAARSLRGVSVSTTPAFVTLPHSGPEIPLASIKLWLQGDKGTEGVGKVSMWIDQSGNSQHAANSNPANYPTLISDGVNGMPVIRFDGGSTALFLPNFMSGATQGEAFVVLKAATNDANSQRRYLWRTGAPFQGLQYPGDGQGRICDDFGSADLHTTFTATTPLTSFNIYNASSMENAWSSRLNGDLFFATKVNRVLFRSDPGLGSDGNTASFNGDIAELIVLDKVLTSSERQAVSLYLSEKFNLGLNHRFTDFYDSNGDGISDSEDIGLGFDPYSFDVDGDGLTNVTEVANGTSPFTADTDHDGFSDRVDFYPVDSLRWNPPTINSNDHTGPVVTLNSPAQATLN